MHKYRKRTDKFETKYYCCISIRRTVKEELDGSEDRFGNFEILDELVTESHFHDCRNENAAHKEYDRIRDFIFNRRTVIAG